MESWKTHLTDGMGLSWFHLLDGSFMIPSVRWVFHDSICQDGSFMIPSVKMGLSWFHLSDGSFMIPSVRWVFHDSICQMGLSWFHLSNHERPICQMESWKTHLPDGIMKDPSARWNHERPICQMESWKTHLTDGIMKDPSNRWDGSFMIPSVRWVFHDSIC